MNQNAVVVVDDEDKPFSERERRRLAELQKVIEQDFQAFYRVGLALAEIKAGKLYRVTHKGDFEGYCKQYFDLAKSRTSQLIEAAEVYDNLMLTMEGAPFDSAQETDGEKTSTTGGSFEEGAGSKTSTIMEVLPKNERQIRPLTRLRPEQQRLVWQSVIASLPEGKKPCASAINKAVKDYLGEEVKSGVKEAKKQAVNLGPEDFQAAFDAFFHRLQVESLGGYKNVSREHLVNSLDACRAKLAEDGALLNDRVVSSSRDANKLERAGYRLFRIDQTSMTIKERAGGGWAKHAGPFETKKAMVEAYDYLLVESMNLAG